MSDSWLSLRISRSSRAGGNAAVAVLRISVPKKIVPLAVRRNRVKRLIREATRKNSLCAASGIYSFRVHALPARIGLADVRAAVERCLARQINT